MNVENCDLNQISFSDCAKTFCQDKVQAHESCTIKNCSTDFEDLIQIDAKRSQSRRLTLVDEGVSNLSEASCSRLLVTDLTSFSGGLQDYYYQGEDTINGFSWWQTQNNCELNSILFLGGQWVMGFHGQKFRHEDGILEGQWNLNGGDTVHLFQLTCLDNDKLDPTQVPTLMPIDEEIILEHCDLIHFDCISKYTGFYIYNENLDLFLAQNDGDNPKRLFINDWPTNLEDHRLRGKHWMIESEIVQSALISRTLSHDYTIPSLWYEVNLQTLEIIEEYTCAESSFNCYNDTNWKSCQDAFIHHAIPSAYTYTISDNEAPPTSRPTQFVSSGVYLVNSQYTWCDMENDEGGWDLAMQFNVSSQFTFDDCHWTNQEGIGEQGEGPSNKDGKYASFWLTKAQEIRICFQASNSEDDMICEVLVLPNAYLDFTLYELFTEIEPNNEQRENNSTFLNSKPDDWYALLPIDDEYITSQYSSCVKQVVINYEDYRSEGAKARIGVVFNEGCNWQSADQALGLGIQDSHEHEAGAGFLSNFRQIYNYATLWVRADLSCQDDPDNLLADSGQNCVTLLDMYECTTNLREINLEIDSELFLLHLCPLSCHFCDVEEDCNTISCDTDCFSVELGNGLCSCWCSEEGDNFFDEDDDWSEDDHVEPTSIPSEIPTSIPSVVPSFVPTVVPTSGPSTIPSIVPTVVPSINPTTNTPSLSPSITLPPRIPVKIGYLNEHLGFPITLTEQNDDTYSSSFSYFFNMPANSEVDVVSFVNNEQFGEPMKTVVNRNADRPHFVDLLVLTKSIYEDRREIRIAFQLRTKTYSTVVDTEDLTFTMSISCASCGDKRLTMNCDQEINSNKGMTLDACVAQLDITWFGFEERVATVTINVNGMEESPISDSDVVTLAPKVEFTTPSIAGFQAIGPLSKVFPNEIISYDVYANTDGKSLGYWFTTINFDVNLLQFEGVEIGELWTQPILLVNTETINEEGVLDIWSGTHLTDQNLLIDDALFLITVYFRVVSTSTGYKEGCIQIQNSAMSEFFLLLDYDLQAEGSIVHVDGSSNSGNLHVADPEFSGMFVTSQQTQFINTAMLNLESVSTTFQLYHWFEDGSKTLVEDVSQFQCAEDGSNSLQVSTSVEGCMIEINKNTLQENGK